MNRPTDEQRPILEDDSRIRVVQAVPGSGKTWLVAELIRRELQHWHSQHAGLAALSFTRVGGDEIRRAVGHDLGHPHFVGTLDAFLFRYVIRPFAQQVWPGIPSPRLVPADWEPHRWWQNSTQSVPFEVTVGVGKARKAYNVFAACFLREEAGRIILGCKARDREPLEALDDSITREILTKKKAIWRNRGILTHSDAAFLASKILTHSTCGQIARQEVLRRFPLVIVDELQDTGWFLGISVLSLLQEPAARAVLVGDPDQAIYEFNGARPDLFERFTQLPDAKTFPLSRTLRCPSAVCQVAGHLASSNRHILPAEDRSGRAILLTFNAAGMEAEIGQLRDWLDASFAGRRVKIIARQTKTVEKITGKSTPEAPKLHSVPMNHLHRAVKNLLQGRQVSALAAVRAALEQVAFDCELATEEERISRGLDPVSWKQACLSALLEASRVIDGETFETWGERAGQYVEALLQTLLTANCNGKRMRRPGGSDKTRLRSDYLPSPQVASVCERTTTVQTVHAVKGETHDVTIMVCPEPRKTSRCPSTTWWSSNESDQEERRIAFVAFTRTKGDLILCVSEACRDRLLASRADFLADFHVTSVADFVARNGQLRTTANAQVASTS